jgi:hypothetical protein
MKITFPLYILLLSTQAGFTQEGRTRISLSSGLANTSAKEKDNLIGNGHNFQADVFMPFYRKGWDGSVKGGFELGITVSGNYTSVKNLVPANNDVSGKYKVYNTAVTIDSRTSRSNSNSFSGLIGLEASFSFGKIYIAPAISTGYMSFQQEGSTQTGSITINGQQQQKELVKKEHESTNGFILKPQLKIGYSISENISLFAGTAIVRGPELTRTTSYLVPDGGFKENNTYEVSQLAKGSWSGSNSTSRYAITEFNIGLSIGLGKKKKTPQPIKGQGAASASYAATGKLIQPETDSKHAVSNSNPAARKSINEKGVKRSEVASMAKPGNPIGGIIVKGGKNPGGNSFNLVSNEKGEIMFTISEAGNYLLQITGPDQPAGKSISEQGVKRSEAAAMAKPGQPIGGIVVKGGKNPGGNTINIVSNNNGEILLTGLEAGEYLLILHSPAPETPSNHKKKKGKEKERGATPGMKDVIKTQV